MPGQLTVTTEQGMLGDVLQRLLLASGVLP